MKIKSMAPFAFRKMSVPKGESEIDFDALSKEDRKRFDTLVKAGLIETLEPMPKAKPKKAKSSGEPSA
ncbi:MAG TPA: hypothetical protein VM580_06315 [Labilithrix sp.]|jgi:hypothetical protein|nr:hypothetical protein [Labilithrix sp.]